MVRNNKTKLSKLLSLIAAVILCFTVFTVPVSAAGSDESQKQKDEKSKIDFLDNANTQEPDPGIVEPVYENGRWNRVHSLPETFEKNFILSPELKEYSITKYGEVVSEILTPDMSDLEKYYTLAIWLNRNVDYDWLFWPAGYDFDYYSHQWDAIGIIDEKKSVCAGIAVAYANLCHAADLPCKFIRMKPASLDHTINYIPNINGHAYYIDVTENYMFMSEKANPWDPMDLDFSHIPASQTPDDGSFEYYKGSNQYSPSEIKLYYDTPFDKWFRIYALHKNTKKTFKTKYHELGSGTRGKHYASYKDYPKQFSSTEKPGLWFLEDFYKDPKTISSKVLSKEFDEQLLNISGIQGSYDCNTAEELAAAVSSDIAIKYFPSSENGEVVPKSAALTNNTHYTVSCNPEDFDPSTGEATITIAGAGEYHGEYRLPVRINSAFLTKDPVNHMDLIYSGAPQVLVDPAEAGAGTILYAVHKKGDNEDAWKKGRPDAEPYPEPADLNYTEELPTATDAGRYDVWYKLKGDENHFDMPPQHVTRVAIISPLQPKIIADNITIKAGEKIKLEPSLDIEKPAKYDYSSNNERVVTVSRNGMVKAVGAGTTTISIVGTLDGEDPNYDDPDEVEVSVKVSKGENPMKLTARTATVKRSKLKKKEQTIKRADLIAVSKAKGKRTYKLVTAKKGQKSFKKYFKVNSRTGNVTVKKGLKKGNYLVKVKVKAAGNASYKPSSWKYVTSTVRVK